MRKERQSVFIFPEGTRSYADGPEMGAFKKGAFHLAVKAGVDIVPVVAGNYWGVLSVREQRFRGGRIPVTGELGAIYCLRFPPSPLQGLDTRIPDLTVLHSTTTNTNSPPESSRRRRTDPDDAGENVKRASSADKESDGPESRQSNRGSWRGRSGTIGDTKRNG